MNELWKKSVEQLGTNKNDERKEGRNEVNAGGSNEGNAVVERMEERIAWKNEAQWKRNKNIKKRELLN